jgi:hypothetical protein
MPITVSAGTHQIINEQLAKNPGTLVFQITPDGATVYIEDVAQVGYQFSLAPGNYRWTVVKAAYQAQQGTVTIVSGQTVVKTINLIGYASVKGHVTNASNGQVVAGATVFLGTFQTLTDSQGNYLFSNVPVGDYTFIISASGYVAQSNVIAVTTSQITLDIALVVTTLSFPAPDPNVVAQVIAAKGFKILSVVWSTDYPFECGIQYVTGLVPSSNVFLKAGVDAYYTSVNPTGKVDETTGLPYVGNAGGDYPIPSTPGVYTLIVSPNYAYLTQLINQGFLSLPIYYFGADIIVYPVNAQTGGWGATPIASDSWGTPPPPGLYNYGEAGGT